jgi:hypothetical protein
MNDSSDPYPATGIRRSSRGPLLPQGMILSMGFALTMINLFWYGMTACCCSNWLTSASSIPAFLICTGLLIQGRYNARWERLSGLFFWIAQGFLLLNNMMDVLWYGHSAWIR